MTCSPTVLQHPSMLSSCYNRCANALASPANDKGYGNLSPLHEGKIYCMIDDDHGDHDGGDHGDGDDGGDDDDGV